MNIVIFGGSFNPPHKGHLNAAMAAAKQLRADRFLIIPDYLPPHKELSADAPEPEQRLELCKLCFAGVPGAEVSDLELRRGGKSFTSDTLRQLKEEHPDAELTLLVGSDMLRTLDTWHEADYILKTARIFAFSRAKGDKEPIREAAKSLKTRFGARIEILELKTLPAASTDIRRALRFRGGTGLLTDEVYAYIVKHRLYGVRVNFRWLRNRGYAMLKPRRVAHVRGCEAEARRLAERWNADPDKAAEAAILHDCTKKEELDEQLRLCEKYGIIPDEVERVNGKLLHAKTGAAVAEREFGMRPDVVSAIRWHTTGKPGMTLLEKIMYMADYIEPNREFEGVGKLRELAYADLDRALLLGFEMSIAEVASYGGIPHPDTANALRYYKEKLNG